MDALIKYLRDDSIMICSQLFNKAHNFKRKYVTKNASVSFVNCLIPKVYWKLKNKRRQTSLLLAEKVLKKS